MALDGNYFNSIDLDPIKRRYYDITSVDNILVDIRKQAELINRRYEEMQAELENVRMARDDYKAKGQALSQEILVLRNDLSAMRERAEEAEARANEFETVLDRSSRHLASLQEKDAVRESDDREQRERKERDFVRFKELYSSMKNIFLSGMETLDSQWETFCQVSGESEPPKDIVDKVGRIADTLKEINEHL